MKNYKQLKEKYKNMGLDLESDDIGLYQYEREDGSFDYELYKKAQTRVNLEKYKTHGGGSATHAYKMGLIADYIKINVPDLKFGLCHGTRTGDEQEYFRQFLGIDVLGTEISHTATEFPNTIEWDFHEAKEEWIGNVCFIFSNSLDHSYDPVACLQTWMKCIKPGGNIFIQRSPDDDVATYLRLKKTYGETSCNIEDQQKVPADIFHANAEAFEKLVEAAGKKEWDIITKIQYHPVKSFFVLGRK